MDYKINRHVERLRKFLPFRPDISEIIVELQREAQKLDLKTRAIDCVGKIIQDQPKLILLTGNAGHGKTYICEKLLREYAHLDDAKDVLRSESLCETGVRVSRGGDFHIVRVHPDLSQLSSEEGAKYLAQSLKTVSGTTTIICVNEGHLRSVLSSARKLDGDWAIQITKALDDCIDRGIASSDGQCYIINLNFQSVVAPSDVEGGTLISAAMHQWLLDKRSWQACGECKAADCECPIFNNRRLLAEDSSPHEAAASLRRRQGIEQLFRMAELSGHVTTIREMLMVIAYLVTGDVSCKQVATERARTKLGLPAQYAFHRLIFAPDLKSDRLDKLPILRRFRAFDPGRKAWRLVDDRYAIGLADQKESPDLLCQAHDGEWKSAAGIATGGAIVTTGSETGDEEARELCDAITTLRRRDFFDLWSVPSPESDVQERSNRIGFTYMADFVWIQSRGNEDRQRLNAIKKDLVGGLQVVQGLSVLQGQGARLCVTHPAFARLQRRVALVSGLIDASEIVIRVLPTEWVESKTRGAKTMVHETVDWAGREIVVAVRGIELRLDLERFEYLRRAGQGYVSRRFFATDIRRILNFLGRVVVGLDEDDKSVRISTPRGAVDFSISEGLVQ